MIKYNLKCKNNHEFESWFSDSKEFDNLKRKKCKQNEVMKNGSDLHNKEDFDRTIWESMIENALASTGFLFRTAVMIVLPIVSILFFMNVGIGFITKSAPQLNLFSFGFPMTILGTFFALYFSVDALQFVFKELIDEAIGFIKIVLGDLGNGR